MSSVRQSNDNKMKDGESSLPYAPQQLQQFGYLIAGDKQFERVLFASDNISALFNTLPDEILGQDTLAFFDRHELHRIRNVLGHGATVTNRETVFTKEINGDDYQVSAHRTGEHAVIELIRETLPLHRRALPFEKSRTFLSMPISPEGLDVFLVDTTEYLRSIVGYDRVSLMKFLPNGDADVVAEARHPDMDSLQGQRFSASVLADLTQRSSASCPIRVIGDVDAPEMGVIGSEDATSLDVTLAVLLGAGDQHGPYLKAMGVRSAVVVPVVLEDQQWGVFTCHHRAPVQPSPSMLDALDLIGRLVGLRIQHALEVERQRTRARCLSLATGLVVLDSGEDARDTDWSRMGADLMALMRCDGVLLGIGDTVKAVGDAPMDGEHILKLASQDAAGGTVLNNPADLVCEDETVTVATALVVSVAGSQPVRVAFLRNAGSATVTWAKPWGEPTAAEAAAEVEGISEVEREALAWTPHDLYVADTLWTALCQTMSAQANLRESRDHHATMARELNHRVRNILTLIQSMSLHSRDEGNPSGKEAGTLEQRVLALLETQYVTTGSEYRGVPLEKILHLELGPRDDGQHTIRIGGPRVAVTPEAASTLSVVFHELAANAVSMGGLSATGGEVAVRWKVGDDGLQVSWTETGGAGPEGDGSSDFSLSIIREAIPYELGGRVSLEYTEAGMETALHVPAQHVVGEGGGALRILRAGSAALKPDLPRLGRALVVEDNYVIAKMESRLLVDAGFDEVDAAARMGEAQAYLDAYEYDFCLLDIKLGSEDGTHFADALIEKGVPFAFVTGYADEARHLMQDYGASIIAKPIDVQDLEMVLSSLKKD